MGADTLWKHNESATVIGRFLSYDRKTGETTIELNADGVKFIKEAGMDKKAITREEAIEKLNDCIDNDDTEMAHADADSVLTELLKSLGYRDVVNVFSCVKKWYA